MLGAVYVMRDYESAVEMNAAHKELGNTVQHCMAAHEPRLLCTSCSRLRITPSTRLMFALCSRQGRVKGIQLAGLRRLFTTD
jgi:hypothetical protein